MHIEDIYGILTISNKDVVLKKKLPKILSMSNDTQEKNDKILIEAHATCQQAKRSFWLYHRRLFILTPKIEISWQPKNHGLQEKERSFYGKKLDWHTIAIHWQYYISITSEPPFFISKPVVQWLFGAQRRSRSPRKNTLAQIRQREQKNVGIV